MDALYQYQGCHTLAQDAYQHVGELVRCEDLKEHLEVEVPHQVFLVVHGLAKLIQY